MLTQQRLYLAVLPTVSTIKPSELSWHLGASQRIVADWGLLPMALADACDALTLLSTASSVDLRNSTSCFDTIAIRWKETKSASGRLLRVLCVIEALKAA